jgi:hypothetical protein
VLFDYDAADTLMRISALRRLGFTGRRVAAVLGLSDNYVATLHSAALREGSAALIRHARPGRPSKLGEPDRASAAAWRGQGLSDTEIGRRLRIAHTTVGRRLGPRRAEPAAGAQAAGPAGSPRHRSCPPPSRSQRAGRMRVRRVKPAPARSRRRAGASWRIRRGRGGAADR